MFPAAVQSSSWSCSTRSSVCFMSHQLPARIRDYRSLLSPASNHIKSFAQASYFTFSVAQGVLIEKSALCSHTLHQEQGCRAELSPQHQSSNQLNPTDQTDHLDPEGSCNQHTGLRKYQPTEWVFSTAGTPKAKKEGFNGNRAVSYSSQKATATQTQLGCNCNPKRRCSRSMTSS